MTNPIFYQIRLGLIEVLKRIKTANGYWTNLQDASILHVHTQDIQLDGVCNDPDHYPYAIVNTSSRDLSKRLERQKEWKEIIPIVIYHYNETNIDLALEKFISDIDRAVEYENYEGAPLRQYMENPADGVLEQIGVVRVVTDEGFLAPYASAVISVQVEGRYFPIVNKPS